MDPCQKIHGISGAGGSSPLAARKGARRAFGLAGLAPLSASRNAADLTSVYSRWLALGLIIFCLLLYGRGLTYSHGNAGDSFHHLINGIFLYDALHEPLNVMSGPRRYAVNYYSYYPAVSLGYYPPVFPMIEATMMLVFGVSDTTGQLAVLLMAVVFTLFSFAWFRLRLSPLWATAATIVLIASPTLLALGRDIMLEIPALAFMMGAMWAFDRMLRMQRPRWRLCLAWSLLAALAFWTKQQSILLVGVFAVTFALSGRVRELCIWPIAFSAAIVLLAAGGLAALTLALGGDAVGHTVGFTRTHVMDRFNWPQWRYYLDLLPGLVGWPLLALSVVGAWHAVRRRDRSALSLFAWIIVFYVMHSYFKAQDPRYGCFWIPPFVAFAATGVSGFLAGRAASAEPTGPNDSPRIAGILAAGLAVVTLVQGYQSPISRVPDVFQRAAAELRDRLAPFTCLVFVPDRPGRLPVCLRLSLEDLDVPRRDIYSYGRMVRAGQLWRVLGDNGQNLSRIDDSLRDWNVKYLALTRPAPLDPLLGENKIAHALDAVIASGEFREIAQYPFERSEGSFRHCTLHVYERTRPMTCHPGKNARIETGRIPTVITPSTRSDAP